MDLSVGVTSAARAAARAFSAGPGHVLYAAAAPLLRGLCRTEPGRAAVEALMRGGGELLLWAFDGQPQDSAAEAQREWRRILAGIGLSPQDLPEDLPEEEQAAAQPGEPAQAATHTGGCSTCFARCTLDLGPGDDRTCDAVMAINDQMLRKLGGRMRVRERLTDPGATRCVVTVEAPAPEDGKPLWFDEDTAADHFDTAASFYDWIMGYYEIPANRVGIAALLEERGEPRERAERDAPGNLARPLLAVDLGAGTGLSTRALLRALPLSPLVRVCAVDRSAAMLRRTSERARRDPRLLPLRGDAARTGLSPATADLIYSSFLLDLHDARRRAAILAEARRLLRPDGVACFVVMDGAAPRRRDRLLADLYSAGYGRWNPLWMALFRGYAPHCRPIPLAADLRAAGFTIVRRERSYVTAFPVAIYVVRPARRGASA